MIARTLSVAVIALSLWATPLGAENPDGRATEPPAHEPDKPPAKDAQTHDAPAEEHAGKNTPAEAAKAKDVEARDAEPKDVEINDTLGAGVHADDAGAKDQQPADAHTKDAEAKDGHGADAHAKDAEAKDGHGADARAKDAEAKDGHGADAHAKDAEAKDGGAEDAHANDAHGEGAHGKGAESKNGHGEDAHAKEGHGGESAHEKEEEKVDYAREAELLDAKDDSEQPYHLVRTLEEVQDRIAQGSAQAHGFQRHFIAEIATKMLAAGDDAWQRRRNTRSAIVYVLSGGDPRVLRKLLTLEPLPVITPELIKGVIAYSEARSRQAFKLLDDIDHRGFETRLAGHLALAKAMSAAVDDVPKALGYLDDARLLCPGTLVEEAALRREVLLLSNVNDTARFEMLAFTYLRRFPKSIYAKNFYRSFAIAVVTGKYGTDPKLMKRLEMRLDELSDSARKQLYMAIAEEGVIRGRVELTRLAADRIGYLLQDGGRDAIRLQLYKAAALVVTKEYDYALARLRSIDRSKLSTGDRGLLDSALLLAGEVRRPPQIEGEIKELPPLSSATQVRHGAVAEKSEALDSARKALSQADEALNKDRR